MICVAADYHMHTSFSTDSKAAPEEMVKASIKKGLKNICFTDHYDMDFPFYEEMGKDAFTFNVNQYFEELTKLKDKYKDRIDICIGVEIGLQPHLGAFYKEMTEKYPFDFVIGSVHLVGGEDPYIGDMFDIKSDDEVYRQTFEEILESVKAVKDIDVLGHLDYIVRYGKTKNQFYSYDKYKDIIDEILKVVIGNGKGIEMNMAGFKYGLQNPHPHPDIIKRYKELGGEIITVGADGHAPEQIAYNYKDAKKILKECGFEYYTIFKGRKPIFTKIA